MENANYTTIQGKRIDFQSAYLPVEKIRLDPANPRVQFLVGQVKGDVGQDQLDQMLWDNDAVKNLAQSILQNEGVREPIIVEPIGDGEFIVREGNCRTVASRHLLEAHPGDRRFSLIPAHIYPQDMTDEDRLVMLADFHVARKISWDAYEQARVIHELFNRHGKTYEWLSNHLRMSKSKISEYLTAYKATTDYLKHNPNPDNVRKFSFFQELMKKKELRERFEQSDEFREEFYALLDFEKLTDARQVRSLPEVLKNDSAKEALENDGFPAAMRILIQDDPAKDSNLFNAVKVATRALREAPLNELQDLKSGHVQKLIMLRDLKRALEDLTTLTGVSV